MGSQNLSLAVLRLSAIRSALANVASLVALTKQNGHQRSVIGRITQNGRGSIGC